MKRKIQVWQFDGKYGCTNQGGLNHVGDAVVNVFLIPIPYTFGCTTTLVFEKQEVCRLGRKLHRVDTHDGVSHVSLDSQFRIPKSVKPVK